MSTTPTTPLANPKVRTVTAFLQINTESYETQMMEAVGILRNAKTIFESKGYEVETLRVTTEPFGDYVNGMAEDEAMASYWRSNRNGLELFPWRAVQIYGGWLCRLDSKRP